ncbi:MAG TPA: AMP-binding protein [Actinocrinis sp.]
MNDLPPHRHPHPTTRVNELISLYSDPAACAATLFCDRYPADQSAYTIVDRHLRQIRLTYGDLRDRSTRFAAALAELGVRPGDRVATLMGKSADYLTALLGIWRVGAVHVPLFTAFAPPAIAFRLERSGAGFVVCDRSQRRKLDPGDDIPVDAPWRVIVTDEPGDPTGSSGSDERDLHFADLLAAADEFTPAALGGDAPLIHIFTSGTTGRPKGVIVPVKAVAGFRIYAEYALGLVPQDLYWCAADPGWAYGLYFGILGSLSTGVPSVLLDAGFSAELTWSVLSDLGVTNFTAAPTVYRSLRASNTTAPGPLRLRCASSAGEPLTPEVNGWAVEALGVPVFDHYGQTEAGMLINNHQHPDLRRPVRNGCMGRSMPGWDLRVLDNAGDVEAPVDTVGRIAAKVSDSPLAWFAGYDGDPAKTADKFTADGEWYLTGDAGRMDAEGNFFFSARDDDVIIMAGYRIGPFDVESVLLTHPDVVDAAVIAVPDAIRGEVIEAYIVTRPAVTTPAAELAELAEGLKQLVKTKLAAHAYPRRVHFVDALPKTPSGKTQRYLLRDRRRAELEASNP